MQSNAGAPGRQTCVVHGDSHDPGNVRMTADRVALIDWDETHVDVPTSTWYCHTTALDSTTLRKRGPRGMPSSAATTSTHLGGSPQCEQSEH
jgi:aminoglycoside phosphotransferase (APT) family kinase protein